MSNTNEYVYEMRLRDFPSVESRIFWNDFHIYMKDILADKSNQFPQCFDHEIACFANIGIQNSVSGPLGTFGTVHFYNTGINPISISIPYMQCSG